MVKTEVLSKSWLVSELTGTNNSHSICGSSQQWRMCLQRLRSSSQRRRRSKEAACMWCLPCREPQTTPKTSRVCPSQAPSLRKFPRLYVLVPLDWVSPDHKLYTRAGHGCMCVCVRVCVCVCVHLMTSLQKLYVTEKNLQILERS